MTHRAVFVALLVLLLASGGAAAQAWAPQRNVEIVAASAPGGSNDKTARMLEHLLSGNKLVTSSITVVNKPGGGSNIANTYVAQRVGDAHVLLIAGNALMTNHIIGASKLTIADFTPIASMAEDYAVFAVTGGSPLKSGKDLVERMQKDARSVSTGFANAFGSTRHIAAALFVKALGGNPRDLKVVVFKGSAEAIPAVLGGHIDLAVVGAVNAVPHVAAGRMRILGVGAPQRLPGVFANAPTWREQGIDVVYGSWRGVFAPRGLTPQQSAFWESAMQKIAATPEWKSDLEKNLWTDNFLTGAALRKEIERELVATRTVLTEIGLAK
ncbi:MAG TPA: tripartite tricarboxylate transporter substrate binding protein [Burkholderiales bacterium]|nr:tripartite tricarboxylate transporter substrate binding protein [Burkholderiales bacterium]